MQISDGTVELGAVWEERPLGCWGFGVSGVLSQTRVSQQMPSEGSSNVLRTVIR